jgi:hypothetical protein
MNGYSDICPPGSHDGLAITVKTNDLSAGYDLGKISFMQRNQLLVQVDASNAICTSFSKIKLQIQSTCEMETSNSAVNQYDTATTAIDTPSDSKPIDYTKKKTVIAQSKTFDVSWKPLSSPSA